MSSIFVKLQGRYRWRDRWSNRPFTKGNDAPSKSEGVEDTSTLFDASIAESGTEPELVFGEDDRIQIKETTKIPWRMICSLTITAADGSKWLGTGWFSSPFTVITAGHCIYMRNNGGWVDNIVVSPGKNGSQEPFGSCVTTDVYGVKEWIQDGNTSFDYGAIILPKNCRSNGSVVGYFNYANMDGLDGALVNISGYPGDKPRGTQWYASNIVKSANDVALTYYLDTAGGQSGSPVWYSENDNRYVVGIHTNGDVKGNYATRINNEVLNNIREWSRA